MNGDDPLAAALRALPGFEAPAADDDVSSSPSVRDLDTSGLPDRYRVRRHIASGGSAHIFEAVDDRIQHGVALKILRTDASERTRARAQREVYVTARLHHPQIVDARDQGKLPDGRVWLVTKLVPGRSLAHWLDQADTGLPLPFSAATLLDQFRVVCEAVGSAHRAGVIHRDLKPGNLIVEQPSGRIWIIDWGLALEIGKPDAFAELPGETAVDADARLTLDGATIGTRHYMAPEQMAGHIHAHGPPSDVYALGVILGELLTLAAHDERDPLESDPLRAVARRACALKSSGRFPNASEMADAVARALAHRQASKRLAEFIAEHRAVSSAFSSIEGRIEAVRRRLEALAGFASLDVKGPIWEEEEALQAERDALAARKTAWEQEIRALSYRYPDFEPLRAELAEFYAHDRLPHADQLGGPDAIKRFELLLNEYDTHGRYTKMVTGMGELTVSSVPPGAHVTVRRYTRSRRRLVLGGPVLRARTPSETLDLHRGRYLLECKLEGHVTVRRPFVIHRGQETQVEIALPVVGALFADDIFVSGGECIVGGDPIAVDALPRARVWIDDFVVKRDPVTIGEYCLFLNETDPAGAWLKTLHPFPRLAGCFELDGAGVRPRPEFARLPIVRVSWHDALAFTRWRSAHDGVQWRLPHELEFEKAARGTDGRLWPWGDAFDPVFTQVLDSTREAPGPAAVDALAHDLSPYGVRGLAGNVRTWCHNAWRHRHEYEIDGFALNVEAAPPQPAPAYVSVRGGAWDEAGLNGHRCRPAARFGPRPDDTHHVTGLRLARSMAQGTGLP